MRFIEDERVQSLFEEFMFEEGANIPVAATGMIVYLKYTSTLSILLIIILSIIRFYDWKRIVYILFTVS